MDMPVPMGQLLLQQGYFDSTILTQLHQFPQQQSSTQDLYVPPLEKKPALNNQTLAKPKRKQVKNACVHCQRACKKCDDGRPCQRCLKYNLADTCRDSIRKKRQKGMKRGPYKRKPVESSTSQRKNKMLSSGQTAMNESNVISQATNTQTTFTPMPVLPAFVTPDASPNNNKDVFVQALTTAAPSSQDMPNALDYHDLLMMPFSFDDSTTMQQDHFPLVTTTITPHEHDMSKEQQIMNDVPTFSTPKASLATTPATQFRFISQNNDFVL